MGRTIKLVGGLVFLLTLGIAASLLRGNGGSGAVAELSSTPTGFVGHPPSIWENASGEGLDDLILGCAPTVEERALGFCERAPTGAVQVALATRLGLATFPDVLRVLALWLAEIRTAAS